MKSIEILALGIRVLGIYLLVRAIEAVFRSINEYQQVLASIPESNITLHLTTANLRTRQTKSGNLFTTETTEGTED